MYEKGLAAIVREACAGKDAELERRTAENRDLKFSVEEDKRLIAHVSSVISFRVFNKMTFYSWSWTLTTLKKNMLCWRKRAKRMFQRRIYLITDNHFAGCEQHSKK